MTLRQNCLLSPFALFAFAVSAKAQVKLPTILADHMVLQRNMPIHIWGMAAPGEAVTVELNKNTESAKADASGSWSVDLPQMMEGGPYEVHVKGANSITLKDVMIGDLWLAGGQSNMGQKLTEWEQKSPGDNAIRDANHPEIRIFAADLVSAPSPQWNLTAKVPWSRCSPSSVGDFSAAGYFFAQQLSAAEHVPIGVIDIAWGGTVAEAWISPAFLAADPALKQQALQIYAGRHEDQRKDRKSANDGRHIPSADYNGMISPITPLRIKGIIWYQGADNTSNAEVPIYTMAAPKVFYSWRAAWHENFAIIIGQQSTASPHVGVETNWPVIRNVQRIMAQTIPDTGMIVTIDLNKNPDDVHDIDKPEMGRRFALAARAVAYHEKVPYSGPLFASAAFDGSAVKVSFTHAESGLVVKNGGLKGFELAGSDKSWAPADATIDGDKVMLSSPKVTHPMYVRYGWAGVPIATLYNGDGFPASPFTSEN
jgi:sialate O-acetylesterase